MNGRICSVVTLCFLCTVLGVNVSDVKIEDIEYWDIDQWTDMSAEEKAITKAFVVKQMNSDLEQFTEFTPLDVGEEQLSCPCPKIFGPVVCDSNGKSHANTCIFACHKRKSPELKPRKIFVAVNHDVEPSKLCKLNLL